MFVSIEVDRTKEDAKGIASTGVDTSSIADKEEIMLASEGADGTSSREEMLASEGADFGDDGKEGEVLLVSVGTCDEKDWLAAEGADLQLSKK